MNPSADEQADAGLSGLAHDTVALIRAVNAVCGDDREVRLRAAVLLAHIVALHEESVAATAADTAAAGAADEGDAEVDYNVLVEEVRAAVRRHVPAGARVAVISRGDAQLVDIEEREMSHFPQDRSGSWAGFYPRDGIEAANLLSAARSRGVCWLVVPATSGWWLDHYHELHDALSAGGTLVSHDRYSWIWSLPAAPLVSPSPAPRTAASFLHALVPNDADVFAVIDADQRDSFDRGVLGDRLVRMAVLSDDADSGAADLALAAVRRSSTAEVFVACVGPRATRWWAKAASDHKLTIRLVADRANLMSVHTLEV
jgi:hypothetical protein